VADEIRFSRSLYLPEAVEAAAEAYGQVAKVVVSAHDDEIVATIDADERYGDRSLDAFANHVLFESIVRSREQLGGVVV
jgi:hypothetical protein